METWRVGYAESQRAIPVKRADAVSHAGDIDADKRMGHQRGTGGGRIISIKFIPGNGR